MGKLSENPTDWLKDSSWKTYQAKTTEDGKQSYTIQLSEDGNIVEIKAGDATTYHVILARGLDVTIDNVHRSGKALEVGDTAKITMENMIPPMFKMADIYTKWCTVYVQSKWSGLYNLIWTVHGRQ